MDSSTNHESAPSRQPREDAAFWVMAAVAAVALRLVLLPLSPTLGYLPDHDDFMRWSIQAADQGVLTLYDAPPPRWNLVAYTDGQRRVTQRLHDRLCNYPPLAGYVLWGVGEASKAISSDRLINTTTSRMVLALPGIAADIVIALGCAAIVARRRPGGAARLAYILGLFLPPLWWDTVIWGQVDSWALAPAVWMLWAMLGGRWLLAGALWGVMCGLKTQGILMVPVWGLAIFVVRPAWRPLAGIAVAAITLAVASLPHMLHSGDKWLRSSYIENFTAYSGYTTLYAFNIWYADALLLDSTDEARTWFGVPKGRCGKVLLAAAMGGAFAWMALRRRGRPEALLLWAPLSLVIVVMLPTQVHERYLLLALPFLLAAALLHSRVWPAFVLLTIVGLAQVTWPQWVSKPPGGFERLEKRVADDLARRTTPPPPELAARMEQQRQAYRAERARTEPVEWFMTALGLVGFAAAAIGLLSARPPDEAAAPPA